jgi:hypothetical protein
MGWLEDLLEELESSGGPAPEPVPPPTFMVGPRPFGVARDVAGVEWQTDRRSSGVVRYRAAATEAWTEVVDAARQRDHQRTLAPLTPDTEYQVEVTVIVPKRGAIPATRALTIRTLPAAAPPQPRVPPVVEPVPTPGGTTPDPASGDETPITHEAATVNVLVDHQVWVPGALTQIDPAFKAWLGRYCRGGPTKLVLADMKEVPRRMRKAGFRGRDTALWWTMSRSYAGWNWSFHGHDPDAHLSDQRKELRDFWSNYIETVKSVMMAAPQTTALILENDEVGRCGKTLGKNTERQLHAVRGRVEMGHAVQD